MTTEDNPDSARIFDFDEVRARLSKHWMTLAGLPHKALDRYKRMARRFAQPSARFRSNSIHELMVDEMRKIAGESIFSSGGRSVLRADNDLVVQFKKIDSQGRTKNIKTTASDGWNTQQLGLPGIPDTMRVTLGYRLNRLNTEVIDVSMVARDGDQIIWRENMSSNLDMFAAEPIAAATATTAVKATKKLSAKSEAVAARGAVKKKTTKHED